MVYNLKDFCVEVLEAVCDVIGTSTASTAKSLRLNTAANSIRDLEDFSREVVPRDFGGEVLEGPQRAGAGAGRLGRFERADRLEFTNSVTLSKWQNSNRLVAKDKSNPSGHLTTDDYSIICWWLSKPSNFSACFGQAGKTTIGRPPASKENGYALMAAEVNQKSKSGLNISSKQMKEPFKTYKAKYVKAKKLSASTGFGISEEDQSNGIITITQKLNTICPCFEQMDNSVETITMVDEHDNDKLPDLGEHSIYNASIHSEDNILEERDEEMENTEEQSYLVFNNISLTSNISSNNIPESTPINNTVRKRKASNSLNLNPESHKKTYNSTLASSYAELYESKVEVQKLTWEQERWHLENEQKDKDWHMELTIREKELQYAKEGKDKELEVRMLLAEKEREAMKIKEENALLCAVVGSSRSVHEISKISKLLFNR
ncbi:hypothetical protein PPACK8108_LOCUS10597 [Phakopsora pachyrhizi]|uniref:Uncharacterized protein n=1 Tax=Phakopsora pachyrhizi TaxID=170000 RepID=A0AAV0B0F7_PHAPC|nr:hypothetical protein PPACK8108_LOCUS10597 [Phakopsora pachyrhizi]